MGLMDKLFGKKQKNEEHFNMPKTGEPMKTGDAPKRGRAKAEKVQVDGKILESLLDRYIAFDTETTGLNPVSDRIVEIGAVLFENGEAVDSFHSLINAGVPISSGAAEVNHITDRMILSAPLEAEVYPGLIRFMGNALHGGTIVCAHNAKFDMDFLCNTLARLGYDSDIRYIDTLSLSRKCIKGLENYKQNTVAEHFGIFNRSAHRASADAEVCGRILKELLKIEKADLEKIRVQREKAAPRDEELEVCAFIQDFIVRNGGDTGLLRFHKQSSGHIDVSCLYTVLKFKFAKKGKYIIVEKAAANDLGLDIEPCPSSEDALCGRYFFDELDDLKVLERYIYNKFVSTRKSAYDYIGQSDYCRKSAEECISGFCILSDDDVERLLANAKERKRQRVLSGEKTIEKKTKVSAVKKIEVPQDMVIHAVNDRVPLSQIRNRNNWDKGYDDGYKYWEEGDRIRKDGDLAGAIRLFDKARYNGYFAPVLYESYGMAYRKLKDFDNEVAILEEGIARFRAENEGNNEAIIAKLETRRNKALEMLAKQQR